MNRKRKNITIIILKEEKVKLVKKTFKIIIE